MAARRTTPIVCGDYRSSWISARGSCSSDRSSRRSAKASRVNRPCLRAFWLPRGAPDRAAPPCIRQRLLPLTAGDMQALPERVLAPHNRLANIGPVLPTWLLVIRLCSLYRERPVSIDARAIAPAYDDEATPTALDAPLSSPAAESAPVGVALDLRRGR
jgi:hypothetical protein